MQFIHPFPARMAPEIVLDKIGEVGEGATLLDPMCGSGTVLRAGVEGGLQVIGSDVDPLAILMATVWCKPPTRADLINAAHDLVVAAAELDGDMADLLPWVDDETLSFIDFWFAEPQKSALVKLASALHRWERPCADALRVALSRIIVTKDRGASLGRDISHSRPHKVAESITFDVPDEFLKSVRVMAGRLHSELVRGASIVTTGDSRELAHVPDASIDCIVTSPPYLNALDYLRGHRLSLVWLGYTMEQLRAIRGDSIGAERILIDEEFDGTGYVQHPSGKAVPAKLVGWSSRYRRDAHRSALQFSRVVRPGGLIVLVVGNSRLQGLKIDNARMYADAMTAAGLDVIDEKERHIPTQNRYLPTPPDDSGLGLRMRTEIIITARHRVGGREALGCPGSPLNSARDNGTSGGISRSCGDRSTANPH